MAIKLKDIARIAGVNVSTVSRALNNSIGIGEETRRRIQEIADEMNYTPDFAAKILSGKGSNEVAIIVPELESGYFSHLVNHIESCLRENAYSLVVGMTHHQYNQEVACIDSFIKRKVDGIIVVASMHSKLKEYLLKKVDSNIPIVLIQTLVKVDEYDYIIVDDVYGYSKAIEYFKQKELTEYAFIADGVSSRLRLQMFTKAMNKEGLKLEEANVIIGDKMFEIGGYESMCKLLKKPSIPHVVFAAYDQVAIGALKAIKENNLRVPEDIMLIGYDNIKMSVYTEPALSTISPPVSEIAEQGVRLLIEKINNREKRVVQHISLKPELIIREST